MKTCSCCKVEKPESEFHRQAANKSGYTARCKECSNSKARREWKCVQGVRKTKSVVKKQCRRQDMIVKYGLATVEAMEATNFDD